MAGEIIRPKDLTLRASPVASELMVVDNSVNVGAATIKAVVEAGRPAASQLEAETGTDPTKAMTPLTTKQAIAAQGGGLFASTAQGAKADSALQSVQPGINVSVDSTDPRNPVVSSVGGSLTNILPNGAGGVPRPMVEVIRDQPPSAAWYGLEPGMDNAEVPINKALAANLAISIPPGSYFLRDGLKAQSGATIIGPAGWEKTRLNRRGVWAADTLEIGTNVAGQGSYGFTLQDVLFNQEHPGFTPGTSTSLTDRLTGGQAHVRVWGGTNGLIDRCWIEHCQYGIDLAGPTHTTVRNCHIQGSWDDQAAGMQEMIAGIRVRNTEAQGLATVIHLHDNYLGGYFSPERNITIGDVTYFHHQDAGSAYGVLINGCEGLEIKGGYIGANNRNSVRVECDSPAPVRIVQNIDIEGVFFDGCTEYSIHTGSADGSFANLMTVRANRFNGQRLTHGVWRAAADGIVPMRGVTFEGNISQGHLKTPFDIQGAFWAKIANNIIGSYGDRGGGTGPDFLAGAYVRGNAYGIHFAGNLWGGDLNSFFNDSNNCKWGPYFDGDRGSASNERGSLRVAGGSVVGGMAQTYPT